MLSGSRANGGNVRSPRFDQGKPPFLRVLRFVRGKIDPVRTFPRQAKGEGIERVGKTEAERLDIGLLQGPVQGKLLLQAAGRQVLQYCSLLRREKTPAQPCGVDPATNRFDIHTDIASPCHPHDCEALGMSEAERKRNRLRSRIDQRLALFVVFETPGFRWKIRVMRKRHPDEKMTHQKQMPVLRKTEALHPGDLVTIKDIAGGSDQGRSGPFVRKRRPEMHLSFRKVAR